jgi:hypothetical protein
MLHWNSARRLPNLRSNSSSRSVTNTGQLMAHAFVQCGHCFARCLPVVRAVVYGTTHDYGQIATDAHLRPLRA